MTNGVAKINILKIDGMVQLSNTHVAVESSASYIFQHNTYIIFDMIYYDIYNGFFLNVNLFYIKILTHKFLSMLTNVFNTSFVSMTIAKALLIFMTLTLMKHCYTILLSSQLFRFRIQKKFEFTICCCLLN